MKPSTTDMPWNAITRLLRQPLPSDRPSAIIAWWESRRIAYNVVVGVVGLITAAVMVTVAFTCESQGGAPLGLPDPPALAIVGVLIYGVLANVCYTGGWITELLLVKLWNATPRASA
jgi:hypothetical protein